MFMIMAKSTWDQHSQEDKPLEGNIWLSPDPDTELNLTKSIGCDRNDGKLAIYLMYQSCILWYLEHHPSSQDVR